MKDPFLTLFKKIAFIEGLSFIILLFLAMPMKYIWKILWAVKYVGWAHGALFIAYILLLIVVSIKNKWSFIKIIVAFIASLIPFATFWIENRINKKGNNFI